MDALVRTTAGLRADLYPPTSTATSRPIPATTSMHILSPKLGIVFGPWAEHRALSQRRHRLPQQRRARRLTTIDPVSGESAVTPAPFLVRSEGAEVGLRTQPSKDITSTFAVFLLDFDSEIVFVGDAGTTEASRPSRRVGAEYTLQARLTPWLTLDFDAAYTQRALHDRRPRRARPPHSGAIEGVVGAGLVVR